MHLMVVNCSPRTVRLSNTNLIIKKFLNGFQADGNTAKVYHLSQRNTWTDIKAAFYESDHILFAMPLFVECVPGILLEFLETLQVKEYEEGQERTKISFLLQGGFAEASQLRCGEAYLEKLPSYFNCDYAGTLIKGGMFGVHMVKEEVREKQLQPFVKMGIQFAKEKEFNKAEVTEFAKPEYFPKVVKTLFPVFNLAEKRVMKQMAKSMGCKKSLLDKPYAKYIKKGNVAE